MFSKIFTSVLLGMFLCGNIYSMASQSHHVRSQSESGIDRWRKQESFEVIACSCSAHDEKESVFKPDQKFVSPLFTSAKNLIDASNSFNVKTATDSEHEIVGNLYLKFKKILLNQRSCVRCLTITLHLAIREFADEKCAVHMAKKLVLLGAKVNSTIQYGNCFDSFTPLHWAKRRNFNALEQMLIQAGAKTDIFFQSVPQQPLVIIE